MLEYGAKGCPAVATNRFALDRPEQIGSLKGLGVSEAQRCYLASRHFFEERAEAFVPFKKLDSASARHEDKSIP